MAKTLPQLVKIDRAATEEVVLHVEPYAWQRATGSPQARPQEPDPWDTPTVKLPRDDGAKHKP
jgi:hypothetical protein